VRDAVSAAKAATAPIATSTGAALNVVGTLNVTGASTLQAMTATAVIADSLTVNGDLHVAGSINTLNTETITVQDKLIKLASDIDGGALLNGAGIQVGFDIIQPNNLLYNNGAWNSSIKINMPSLGVTGTSTLAAVTATTLSTTGTSTLASVSASTLSVTGASTLASVSASTLSTTGNTAINGVLRMGLAGTSAIAGYQGGTIHFNGPAGDSSDAFTGIQCKNYTNGTTSNEATELLLWQLNDPYSDSGPDRIRLYAGEIRFDTYIAAVSAGSQYTESTRMIIMPSGWIGIGETNPTAQLHISAGIGVNATVPNIALTNGVGFGASSKPQIGFGYQGTKTYNHYISTRHTGSAGGNSIDFYTCNGVQNNTINDTIYGMTIQNGRVGVNTFNPTDQFHVTGNSTFAGLIQCRGCRYTQGAAATQYGNAINLWWTGSALEAWVDNTKVSNNISDYRVKKNIQGLGSSLEKIMALKPVSYSFRANGIFKESDVLQTGFIAHEVQTVIPDATNGVKDKKDANGADELQSLNVMPILSTLVKAVQELTAKVQALESGLKMHR
jgi:Chaperone of endosialidase